MLELGADRPLHPRDERHGLCLAHPLQLQHCSAYELWAKQTATLGVLERPWHDLPTADGQKAELIWPVVGYTAR